MASLLPFLPAVPCIFLATWAMARLGFNGLYGQDPFAYNGYAVGPLRRTVLHGAPLQPMFWPLGYPIPTAIASLVVGPHPLAGQIVNILAGAITSVGTYLLGRRLFAIAGVSPRTGRYAALTGALLMAVAGRMLESDVTVMADSVALATSVVAAWALLEWLYGEGSARRAAVWPALAGGALAWSAITRWGQVILVLVWLGVMLPSLGTERRSRTVRGLPWAMLPAAFILGTQLTLAFTMRPPPGLGPYPFLGDLGLVGGGGWSPLHLVARQFLSADGLQRYSMPNLLFYASGPFRLAYLTPVFFPAVIAGLWVSLWRYRRVVPLLLVWPAALLLFDAGLPEQNERFILAALPPLALLAGLGVAALREPIGSFWRLISTACIAAGLVLVTVFGMRGMTTLAQERNADLRVTSWTAARVPAGSHVFSFEISLTLRYATRLWVTDIYLLPPARFRHALASTRPTFLLVRPADMGAQWANRNPGRNYALLRAEHRLIADGSIAGYTLYRVRTS
jgi:4-amino-4-deoxy-L-arabinose transferase-like glycosyltransferase